MQEDFYLKVAAALSIDPDDTVLVVCGGGHDRNVVQSIGVKRAVISNVTLHNNQSEYAPFDWQYQDAEKLSLDDRSFDWVFVHAGLHHCASPHWALCEMLRVARKGILVIEARDSLLNSIAGMLGLVPDFEIEPVLLSKGQLGGVRNSNIPNYVYRWTEREFRKTISSFEPAYEHDISFAYGWRLPLQRIAMSKKALVRFAVYAAKALVPFLKAVAPRQGNRFACICRKTEAVKPWIKLDSDKVLPNLAWMETVYDPAKYRRG
ncbi:class I SAM-dependent methyltransferase [Mesorhizobium sp. M0045]|uniref:class I SAM-dependent methyltransferase n=1 Tax=Mesorhizobium sp. M0045 TaxID=2956857 RepID=UPI003337D7BB